MTEFLQTAGTFLSQLFQQIAAVFQYMIQWIFHNQTEVSQWYLVLIRWFMPVLALLILISVLRAMLRVKNPQETWGYFTSPTFGKFPVHHWECTIGRARHCDIVINYPTVSRTQCAIIRDENNTWTVHNLSEKNPTRRNGAVFRTALPLQDEDTLSFGDVQLAFEPISEEERQHQQQQRSLLSPPLAPYGTFFLLTMFQALTCLQLMLTRSEQSSVIATCFTVLCATMWGYVLVCRVLGSKGFEPEILAFFACTLNLAVTASSAPATMMKQTAAIVLGVLILLGLGWYLRDLKRVVKTRHFMAAMVVGLLTANLLFGSIVNGAQNWISIAGISIQPSEIAKVCFIFAGAATLDRLFVRRNLLGFMLLSGFCLGCLALMSDFGTALIFFTVFLVIAYLRSGDFATLALLCGGVAAAVGLLLRFKPYIAARFAVWGHAWEYASTTGYQQVRTMSAAASGGLIGVGGGQGWLHNVGAANTDLVFGIICEEWGLIIGLLSIASIIALSVFSVRMAKSGRSAYYTIAACAATSLLVFQTILNVFGSLDLLPLTGVTFPFISCGGSSMLASWGLLAYLKASDTRQNASFAVRRTFHTKLAEDEYDHQEYDGLDEDDQEEHEDEDQNINLCSHELLSNYEQNPQTLVLPDWLETELLPPSEPEPLQKQNTVVIPMSGSQNSAPTSDPLQWDDFLADYNEKEDEHEKN